MKAKDPKHVKFFLRRHGKNNAKIRAVLSFLYRKAEVATGLEIDTGKWDPDKMRTKANTKHKVNGKIITDKEFDRLLDEIAVGLSDAFNHVLKNSRGKYPEPTEITEHYRLEQARKFPSNIYCGNPFLLYWDAFIQDGISGKLIYDSGKQPAPWNEQTLKKYNNAKWHFENFKPNLQIGEFSIIVLDELVKYLIQENKQNTTTEKIFKCIKVYIKWLCNNGHLDQQVKKDLKEYRLGLKRISEHESFYQNNVALTLVELETLYKLNLPKEKLYLRRTRDIFVFQCYTGLRYSDLKQLTKDDFKKEKGKYGALDFHSVKGQKRLVVPLISIARKILDRYSKKQNDQLLPVITNQKYNEYLKTLAKLAGLNEVITQVLFIGSQQKKHKAQKWEFITSHVARKTFINIGFDLGLRPEIIAEITGSSIGVIMKHYRTITEADKFKAIEVLG